MRISPGWTGYTGYTRINIGDYWCSDRLHFYFVYRNRLQPNRHRGFMSFWPVTNRKTVLWPVTFGIQPANFASGHHSSLQGAAHPNPGPVAGTVLGNSGPIVICDAADQTLSQGGLQKPACALARERILVCAIFWMAR